MTNRPHVFLVRTSDDRGSAAALIGRPAVTGVEIDAARAAGAGQRLRHVHPRARRRSCRDGGIRLRELLPADESLESVFSYLVARDMEADEPMPGL